MGVGLGCTDCGEVNFPEQIIFALFVCDLESWLVGCAKLFVKGDCNNVSCYPETLTF